MGVNRYELLEDSAAEAPLVTHARQRVHLESALRFLDAFLATRVSQSYRHCTIYVLTNSQLLKTLCSVPRNCGTLHKL